MARHRSQPREWSQPGWLEATSSWIRDEVERLGQGPVRSVEQVRDWALSCVLRVQGEGGTWYLKAVPPAFDREPLVMTRLAGLRPGRLPAVVAHDPVGRRHLMPECPGVQLSSIGRLDAWIAACKAYARLQIAGIDHLGDLADLGCPQRSLAELAASVDSLLADQELLQVDEPGGLSERQVELLRARAPELKLACEQLSESPVPSSIDHSDLWQDNILVGDDGPVFLDWTDASLTHPFLSLLPLFVSADRGRQLAGFPDARERLRDAYLGPWRELLPRARLRSVFETALHQAAHYQRLILPLARAEPSVREYSPLYLRTLLERREAAGPDDGK